jgi:hypothetical protein
MFLTNIHENFDKKLRFEDIKNLFTDSDSA